MNNIAQVLGDDFPALFILVTGMLIYRTVDLFSVWHKLEQLALRAHWWNDDEITYPNILVIPYAKIFSSIFLRSKTVVLGGPRISRKIMRNAVRAKERNVRAVLWHLNFLMSVRREFIAGMMLLYLLILTFIGFSVYLLDGEQEGGGASFVVAVATAVVSLLSSAINCELEKIKTYL
ncbi:MAG: hypothetical protein EPO07_18070 [Verrucomicrobia bacterium]|nr:MAG: hypothetical protein EPO07_18070 [Verrucomicrobiota bacterium]